MPAAPSSLADPAIGQLLTAAQALSGHGRAPFYFALGPG
jgi:hypothetical protein